ncbi:MAG TPA: LysR substrate-binding domain-containing protein [Solirubrobacteraceae bacterium]|jgi:DNA-binding transcriptional LysR family regulator
MITEVEARELRYFVTVADELHFGRAAQRMLIALPALSRGIRRLEQELGVDLFVRDSHKVDLTSAGQALLNPARDALACFDEALVSTCEIGGKALAATLTVGVSPLLRHRLGPAIFERFALTYPGVRVSRREEFGALLIEELLARRLDVVLALAPARQQELTYEPVRDAEAAILISERHPLAGRKKVSLSELRREPFQLASAEGSPMLRKRVIELCQEAGFEPARFSVPIDYDEDLVHIRRGEAVALISRFYVEDLPAGVSLLELASAPRMSFELVRHRERPSPALARFAEVVRQVSKLSYEELDTYLRVEPRGRQATQPSSTAV